MVTAKSAYAFADSIGVAAHVDNTLSADAFVQMMARLGLHHIRTGPPSGSLMGTYGALARAGVRFTLFECNVYNQSNKVDAANDVELALAFEAQSPGAVLAMEGCNEFDAWHYQLQGQDSYQNYGSWGPMDAIQLEGAMNDASFNSPWRVSPSVQQIAKMPRSFGDSITHSNSHAYNPDMGGNVQHYIRAGINYALDYAPDLPVMITETGSSSGGYVDGGYSCGTEWTQMVIAMNCALEGFFNGAALTYIYELQDWSGASGAVEENFGLHYGDGSPKSAATALGNLMAIVASATDRDELGELDFEVDGLPDTASSLLLQKADGTFEIVLWDGGAQISDGSQDIEPDSSDVTVIFGQAQPRVNVYDPTQGTAPRSSANSVKSVKTALGATPVIVEIPASTVVASPAAYDTFAYG
jgi:hypothetical protein